MKFLDEIQFSSGNFGIQVVVKLLPGWKGAAKRFPVDKIDKILKPSVYFASRILRELEIIPEVSGGEYGLQHIHLIPLRAGLDLFPDQDSYISHNFTRGEHIAGTLPIVLDYLTLLELV